MSEQITHEVSLVAGYKGHRRVVFGKRVSAKRLFEISANPMASIRTQYDDLELLEMIVEFGTLKMPLPLTTLLDLDTIDRDDLKEASNAFAIKSLGDRKYEFSADKKKVTLAFGLKAGEQRYQVIEFTNRLTGRDEVEADKRGLFEGLRRRAFLAGRQVGRISSLDGDAAIEGTVELAFLDSDDVDGDDLFALLSASELWRQSFRLSGGTVSGIGNGADGSSSRAEVQLERGAGAGVADGAA